ncbi:hypothetical protein RRG08_027171 [Elysia crispata]|uniref:Uncharacterized protein n=1 Tax=Elysia crispata TaxID=231223 RepID=A0AAE1EAM2_9GAST|nr:hypothetical protein RRG08_027171 [Elysia crispata]
MCIVRQWPRLLSKIVVIDMVSKLPPPIPFKVLLDSLFHNITTLEVVKEWLLISNVKLMESYVFIPESTILSLQSSRVYFSVQMVSKGEENRPQQGIGGVKRMCRRIQHN